MARVAAERTDSPAAEAIRAELSRILASQTFARSDPHRRFLRHVVESAIDGQSEVLKEPLLGVDVFQRGADFDPRSDNVVRVEARRLRKRLQEYYLTEGTGATVLIDLPTGGYVPQFTWRTVQESEPVLRPKRTVRYGMIGAVVVAILAAGLFRLLTLREPPLIAVLPFAEYNAGEAGPYLGDAIAEDILQLLAETPRLRVISRTSSFRLKGQTGGVSEIRRRLRVEMLLEGNVKQEGNRIRIAARLVDAKTGVPVWAETADTDPAGLSRAERAIAAGVAKALEAGPPPAPSGHVPSVQARDLLARARYLASKGGTVNRQRAVEHYERAVAMDPNYARAWGELARLLSLVAFHDGSAAERLSSRIKDAAATALRLDPTLADPHVALARLAWSHEWDWQTAELGWKRALEINPNYAGAHQAYALALITRRRFREAIEHSRRAVELDPIAFAASNDLGVVLYASRRLDDAVAQARVSISLMPESPIPHFLLGVVEAARDRYGEATSELEKAASALSRRSRLNRVLDPLLMLPLGASAVTLGLGFIVTFNRPPLDVRSFPLLIPIAHSLVALPFVVRTLQPALASIPVSLRHAAAVLGASPFRVWWEVDLPIVARAALVSSVFAFTISLGEFGATTFLSRPEYPTLPVAIFRYLSQPGALNYGQALAMATLLMLVCAVSILLLERFRLPGGGDF